MVGDQTDKSVRETELLDENHVLSTPMRDSTLILETTFHMYQSHRLKESSRWKPVRPQSFFIYFSHSECVPF